MSEDIIQRRSSESAAANSGAPRQSWWSRFWTLRREIPLWQRAFWGLVCMVCVYGLWWWATAPDADGNRILSAVSFPSPNETFSKFHSLWFERELTINTFASLRRVGIGFLLAAAVGIPIGVACGCFPWINAFFTPLTLFGRNIPIAALVPLTFFLFDIGEIQKVMFIFLAAVAFVVSDSANAIASVPQRFIDSAYTLGLSRWQIVQKVLFPLALPAIFDSLRLLFGLAFGYIMLAEAIQLGDQAGGLGDIINMSQRGRGPREHIYLVLLIIPVVAFGVDRILFFIQTQLFPYQYGGAGILARMIRFILRSGEDVKTALFPATKIADYDKQQEMLARFGQASSQEAKSN
jgi:ABC-type nitrate/sulfonate/bicarbonate transport system permease component